MVDNFFYHSHDINPRAVVGEYRIAHAKDDRLFCHCKTQFLCYPGATLSPRRNIVTPAQAGVQNSLKELGSDFRRNDSRNDGR
jgi:hypothetical protein